MAKENLPKDILKDISFLLGINSPALRETVTGIIRDSGSVKVLQAEKPQDVLKLLRRDGQGRDFFLILDIDADKMPGMDVAREVRGDKRFENFPILILTANVTPDQIAKGGEIGVNGFLIKPFPPLAIAQKCAQIIHARNNPPEHVRLLLEGERLVKEGKLDDALKMFEDSKSLSKSARISVSIGETYEMKKLYKEAHHHYNEAIEINPRYLKAYVVASELMVKTGNYKSALPYLNKALEISPINADRHILKAKIFLKMNDEAAAMEAFKTAIKQDKHKVIAISETLIAAGKAEKAEELLRSYLETDENHIMTYNRLGIALRRQGKWERAVEEYRKALNIYKNDEGLFFNMGKAFYEGGKIERARECFIRAIEINPRFPEAAAELDKLNKIINKARSQTS